MPIRKGNTRRIKTKGGKMFINIAHTNKKYGDFRPVHCSKCNQVSGIQSTKIIRDTKNKKNMAKIRITSSGEESEIEMPKTATCENCHHNFDITGNTAT